GPAAGAFPGAGLAAGTEQSATSVLAAVTAGAFQQVAQLLGASGSALSLIAPLFTVSVLPGEFDGGAMEGGGVARLGNFRPVAAPGRAPPPPPVPESSSSRPHPRPPAPPQPRPTADGATPSEPRSTAVVDAAIAGLVAEGGSGGRPWRASSDWWSELTAAG